VFQRIEQQFQTGSGGLFSVFDLHSSAISALLEDIWAARFLETGGAYALSNRDRAFARLGSAVAKGVRRGYDASSPGWPQPVFSPPGLRFSYDHLIFALCIESTNVYEIFGRVLHEFERGVGLAAPSIQGLNWLRRTRELFYSPQPPTSVLNLTSDINPDVRAARDRAYQLLFGFGIDHATYRGQPFPKIDVSTANHAFRPTLVALFQEIWRNYVNVRNTSGPDDSDPEAVRLLVQQLYGHLTTARRNGYLDQAEFASVAALSWLYTTLLTDTPIVNDLQAQASTSWDRLSRVAARVGMPVHPATRHLFLLAESLSPLLRMVEAGIFNGAAANLLYLPDPANTVWVMVDQAINALQVTMGTRIKGMPQMDRALANGYVTTTPATVVSAVPVSTR